MGPKPRLNDMGRERAIANPNVIRRTASRAWPSEQGIGCRPVRCGLVPMALHPLDLCFEKRDPVGQLVLGIWGEILGCEEARGIAFAAGEIEVIHFAQHRNIRRLLSMRLVGSC